MPGRGTVGSGASAGIDYGWGGRLQGIPPSHTHLQAASVGKFSAHLP